MATSAAAFESAMARAVERGFVDPVCDAQVTFRAALDALANPGKTQTVDVDLPDIGVPTAALATLLSLTDSDTPVWLSSSVSDRARSYLRFHAGTRFAGRSSECAFAYVASVEELPELDSFSPGSAMSPEASTTVVLCVTGFVHGVAADLSGPGCKAPRRLAPDGFTDTLWTQLAVNHSRFPVGIDLLLASGRQLVGIPRSTKISLAPPEA